MKNEFDNLEPIEIKIDPRLYIAIKYNQGFLSNTKISEIFEDDLKEFIQFKKLTKEYVEKINNSSSVSILSSLMNLWGYTRKYCGLCGRPILGNDIHKIQGRLVCEDCANRHSTIVINDKEETTNE